MRRRGLLVAVWAAVIFVGANCVWAQDPPVRNIRGVFQELIEHYDAARVPELDATPMRELESMSSAAIGEMVPYLVAALSHKDDRVKELGLAAVLAASTQRDTGVLLRPVLAPLVALLDSPDKSAQQLAVYAVPNVLKHRPPPEEVIAAYERFVRRTDRDATAQGMAVEVLMAFGPRPSSLAVIEEFASKAASASYGYSNILDAIVRSGAKNERLVSIVVGALKHPDPEIRERAIYNIARIGYDAVSRATSTLQQMAVDPNEPEKIRAAAREAFSRVQFR